MSNNQELVSFPFRPYLAKYLFHLTKNEVIETEEALYKHLDINMKSPDARFLRILMQRKQVQGIKNFATKGFRLTISIPKQARNHTHVVEDSRTKAIWIDEETARLIHDHFDARFRDHFISFVSGAIHGSHGQRNSLKNAILFFMETYNLHKDDVEYNYDQLVKLFERRCSPLKSGIYAKKSEQNS